MPLYDVQCKSCGLEQEIFSSIDERVLVHCTKCRGRVEFLVSTSTKPVILDYYQKHAGFHVTGPKQRERELRKRDMAIMED